MIGSGVGPLPRLPFEARVPLAIGDFWAEMVRLGKHARRAGVVALSAVGGAVVVALVLALALPRLISGDELRRAAAQALSGSTGQRVVILGEPSLSVLPSPRIHLGKVSFPLPAGQSLDAENVDARLDLWHLLAGRVDVTDVIVVRPTLVLTGDGLRPALAVAPALAAQDRPELRIVGGTIAWRTAGGLTRELVSDIDASLDRIMKGRGIALSVELDWREERIASTLILDDATDFLAGTPTTARFLIARDGAKARFTGEASAGTALALDGKLTAEADSLRDLFDWADMSMPGRNGFGDFLLGAHLNVDDDGISLTEATLDLDGNRAEGGLLVKLGGARPVVQGTFATERLNLAPYGTIQLTTAEGREWDRSAIDLDFLRAFDLDLRLSAGQVRLEHSAFETIAASAVLNDGRLVLALGEARGWGGLLQASLTLAPANDGTTGPTGAEVRLEAETSDLDLARALDELAGVRRVEGTGALQFDVQGRGRSVHDIARSLSGTASLTSADGYLSGMDVAQMLQRIERRPLSAVNEARGGRTAFSNLTGRIAIANGVGAVEELRIEGKQMRVTAEGDVSIVGRSLDLSGHAALLLPARGSETTGSTGRTAQGAAPREPTDLPFTVRGPWDNPTIMADPLSLIERSGAAQSLIEAVKSRGGPANAQPALNTITGPAAQSPAAVPPGN